MTNKQCKLCDEVLIDNGVKDRLYALMTMHVRSKHKDISATEFFTEVDETVNKEVHEIYKNRLVNLVDVAEPLAQAMLTHSCGSIQRGTALFDSVSSARVALGISPLSPIISE